jgi:hypothetical protein
MAAGSGRSVDPILIGIIAVGVVGSGVFFWLGSRQKPAELSAVSQPVLTRPQAPAMQGNAAVWGPVGSEQAQPGFGGPEAGFGPGVGAAPPTAATGGVAL